MLKGYQFRIYPNREQKNSFALHFGHTRFVYNWALNLKQETYEKSKKNLSKFELQNQLIFLKKENPWLCEVNSQSLQVATHTVHRAFQNFFKKLAKFPKFKSKHDSVQKFHCPQFSTVDTKKRLLHLPKIKGVKIKLHRPLLGKIKQVIITKKNGDEYYASILVEVDQKECTPPPIEEKHTIGLDVGLSRFLTDSLGNKVEPPQYHKKGEKKVKRAQKILSSKKKGSKNRVKAKKQVAKAHKKIRNQRKDFIHKLSSKYVCESQATTFAFESLDIKRMLKNKRLSRAISSSGWSMFINFMEYKCRWYGKNLIRIGQFAPSSKRCSSCGKVRGKLSLSTRRWICVCGADNDRDHNAACNIKYFALADPHGHGGYVKSSSPSSLVSSSDGARGLAQLAR